MRDKTGKCIWYVGFDLSRVPKTDHNYQKIVSWHFLCPVEAVLIRQQARMLVERNRGGV